MIGKISRGWRAGGLVRYLMGPGRFNEHRDQRVIATWDGAPELHQPTKVGEEFDCSGLVADLSDPQVAAGVPQHEPAAGADGKVPRGPVWHCSLRNHEDDRVLTDEEWAEVVAEVLDRAGIAGRDDPGACRWAVIRHADDHVHIAAVLVRQDNGRRVHPRFDYRRVREVCQEAEERLGLTRTGSADRTATVHPTRPEQEKAQRRDEPAPSREQLRRAARLAAVRAQTPEGFLLELERRGVLTRTHHDVDGRIDGYALAVPGDVDADGSPVWYSGRALGSDLSMTRLRTQWSSAPPPAPPVPPRAEERASVGREERSEAMEEATEAVGEATRQMSGGDHSDAAGTAHATRDLLSALADITQDTHPEVSTAALEFDRAARVPRDVLPQELGDTARALRTAAWRVSSLGALGGRGRSSSGAASLVIALAALVAEIAAYHATKERLVQASAARRSVTWLRAEPSAPSRPPRQTRSGGSRGPARPTPAQTAKAPEPGRPASRGDDAGPRTRGRGR